MLDETLKKGLICMNVLDRLKINIEGYTIQRLTKILRNEDEKVKKVFYGTFRRNDHARDGQL